MSDLDRIDWLLTTTRAVRRRLDLERAVDVGTVLDCLTLALQAPTGGDYQGWRWIVVTDPTTKSDIRDLYLEAHTEAAGGRRPAEVVASADRMLDGAWHLASHLDQVPVLVVACLRGRFGPTTSLAEAGALFGSIYPAVWSFQLALRSRGLASAMTTVHLRRADQMAHVLGIPDGVVQAGLVPVAHLVGSTLRPARRRPVRDVAYRDRWGGRWDGPSARSVTPADPREVEAEHPRRPEGDPDESGACS
jgi:nitroreductase